ELHLPRGALTPVRQPEPGSSKSKGGCKALKITAEAKKDLVMGRTAQAQEVIMLRVRLVCGMMGLAFAATIVVYGVRDVAAQKKLSYEQAFAACKKQVVAAYPPGSSDTVGRNSRGAACMKDYGFNLKKGTKF